MKARFFEVVMVGYYLIIVILIGYGMSLPV